MAERLGIGAAALVAALALSLGGGPAGPDAASPSASAATTKCSKKHHFTSKAAKRRYKRHCRGKGGSPAGSGGGDAACSNTDALPGRLSAQEGEYLIKLSKTSIGCGKVILQQQNIGEDPHDLVLQKAGTASPSYSYVPLGPGLTADQKVDLGRGSWLLYCDLPGHREAGMERTLTVN